MRIKFLTMLIAFLAGSSFSLNAQRPSPAAEASGTIGKSEITIKYSQPAVKEREIWGGLVPFGEVWRTGANEATIITIKGGVVFEVETTVKLDEGTYSLFTIPGKEEWIVIINSQTGQWGTQYDKSKDVVRFKVKPGKAKEFSERLTFEVGGDAIWLSWEYMQIKMALGRA